MSSPDRETRPALPSRSDLVLLGKLTRTQGHRGALRLLPEFAPLDRIERLKTKELFLEQAGKPGSPLQAVHLSDFSYHQQHVIVTFDEIPDMTAAEGIRGAMVYVREDQLWDLDEGEFFTHDIVGFTIVDDATAKAIGNVRRVEPGAGHDFLVVKHAERSGEFLVPLVKEIVHRVDKAERQIRVSLPEGLDEL